MEPTLPPPKPTINSKLLITATVFTFIIVASLIYIQGKTAEQKVIPPLVSPSPTAVPVLVDTVTPTVSQYDSWKSVNDSLYKISFKIPADQNYDESKKIIAPSNISFIVHDNYDGGSRREFVKKAYGLNNSDISVKEYTTANGRGALLIQVTPPSYQSDMLDFIGVIAQGSNLVIVNGKPENSNLIRGILDTFQFNGTYKIVNDKISCLKFDPGKDSAFGKRENGDYFYEMYVTQKMDLNAIRSSNAIFIEAHPVSTTTSIYKSVNFTLTAEDMSSAPYVQKLVMTVTQSEVVNKIGQENYDSANGVVLNINYNNLKTAEGKYCAEGGTRGTNPIK